MKAMPWRRAGANSGFVHLRAAACLALAVGLGGCASSISTPLPDLPTSRPSASMSHQEQQRAVDDLTRARDTHEQAAEREIEQSR